MKNCMYRRNFKTKKLKTKQYLFWNYDGVTHYEFTPEIIYLRKKSTVTATFLILKKERMTSFRSSFEIRKSRK